jgi:hypothetical protein
VKVEGYDWWTWHYQERKLAEQPIEKMDDTTRVERCIRRVEAILERLNARLDELMKSP